jgi:hypothetical protein
LVIGNISAANNSDEGKIKTRIDAELRHKQGDGIYNIASLNKMMNQF